jgi:uncharacterized protein YjbI with pentapeptide repeats
MKKLIVILILYSTHLFAFNEQAYIRLMHGERNLAGADLEGAMIQNIDLVQVDFTGTNLKNVQFSNVLLSSVVFNGTILHGARINSTAFVNCTIASQTSFDYAILDEVTFDRVDIANSSFNFATIRNTDFLNSSITTTTMNDMAVGYKICFIGSTALHDIQFVRSRIQGLIIYGADEIGTQLNFETSQICQGLFLGKATRSFLRQSNFAGAFFDGCFLVNINFVDSKNISRMAAGIKSIFKDVTFTGPEEMVALISKGAKINGEYDGAYKDDWSNESTFFGRLITALGWGTVSGVAQGLGVVVIKLAPAVLAGGSGCCVQ